MNFKREFRSWVNFEHLNIICLAPLGWPLLQPCRRHSCAYHRDGEDGHQFGRLPGEKNKERLSTSTEGMHSPASEGLSYLHGHTPPLVHHDLKPDNVMLNTGNFTAKLAQTRAGLCCVELVKCVASAVVLL